MSTVRQSLRGRMPYVAVFAVVLVAGLLWAKWLPYVDRIGQLGRTHAWPGTNPLTVGDGQSAFADAWTFTVGYFMAVWPAAVVALLVAAGMETLLPATWLRRAFNRRTRFGQAAVAGVASMPSMMCTCCSAPVAAGLRRRGGEVTAALAYWLGNPLLNPAVLVFLFLLLPWQFGVVRLLVAVLVVFGMTPLVGRLRTPSPVDVGDMASDEEPFRGGGAGRYLRALGRLAVVFVPEYVIMVMLVGLVSGSLSGFGSFEQALGVVAVVVVAVVGTLLVIPTGGEVPVVLALSAAGAGAGTTGALLITLPAISVPSMVLLARALSVRVMAVTAGCVAAAGVLGGAALWVLT